VAGSVTRMTRRKSSCKRPVICTDCDPPGWTDYGSGFDLFLIKSHVVIAYRAGSVCVAYMSQFPNVPILRLWRRVRNAIPDIDEY